MNGNRNATSAAIGFMLGAAVGAGIALLLAPATGAETRRRVGETGRRMGGSARRQMDRAVESARELGADAKSALKRGAEKLDEARGTGGPGPELTEP